MNKFSKLIMFSSALIGAQIVSTAAMAQTAPATGTYSGLVIVKKGLTLECTLTLGVDASASTVTVGLAPPTDPRCAALGFVGNPYSYTYSAGVFTISGVYVDTITLGDCSGTIAADWDGTQFLIDTFLPTATVGTPDCTIEGTAS